MASSKGLPVERDQFAPRSLCVRLVVEWFPVLNRYIRHAPTVQTLIDLNFCRNLSVGEGLAKLVFGVRLATIVVGCDADVDPSLDLGRKQVRAVRPVRHKPPAVERCSGANSV